MTINDYKIFKEKINQLNLLIDFIEKDAARKEKFISCRNHNEVVKLAKEWGFLIGKRWGDYNK